MANRLSKSLKEAAILPASVAGGEEVDGSTGSGITTYPKRNAHWGDVLAPYIFIAPFLIFFVIMFVVPSIYSFGLSFFRYKGYGEGRFIGLDNYIAILSYHVFWTELGNTIFYWLAHLLPLMIGAFLLAILIRSKLIKGQAFFKPIIFLPNIITIVAAALVYQSLFSTRYGVINTLSGIQIPFGHSAGAELTIAAFSTAFGGRLACIFIAFETALFAIATILTWAHYGSRCAEYLFGTEIITLYKIVFVVFIVIGAGLKMSLAWDIADTLNGLMAIPNLIALIGLSGVVVKVTKEHFDRTK